MITIIEHAVPSLRLVVSELQLLHPEGSVFLSIHTGEAKQLIKTNTTPEELSRVHSWNEKFNIELKDPEGKQLMIQAFSKQKSLGCLNFPIDSLYKDKEITLLLSIQLNGKQTGEICIQLFASNFGVESETVPGHVDETDLWISPKSKRESLVSSKSKSSSQKILETYSCVYQGYNFGTLNIYENKLNFIYSDKKQTDIYFNRLRDINMDKGLIQFVDNERTIHLFSKLNSVNEIFRICRFLWSKTSLTNNNINKSTTLTAVKKENGIEIVEEEEADMTNILGSLKWPSVSRDLYYLFKDEISMNDNLVSYFTCAVKDGIFGTTGTLYLTNQNLCFYATKLMSSPMKLVVPFNKVLQVKSSPPSYLFTNGIKIRVNQNEISFTSWENRDDALKVIQNTWLLYLKKLNLISSEYSVEELLSLLTQFYRIDVKDEGFIDQKQFKEGLGLPNQYISDITFNCLDSSRKGKINFVEFAKGFLILTRGTDDEKLSFSFQVFDTQNTGSISFQQFSSVLATIYHDREIAINKTKLLFEAIKLDEKSCIQFEQFKLIKNDISLLNLLGMEFLGTSEHTRTVPFLSTFNIDKTFRDILHYLLCGIREACQKPATVTRPNHFHRYKSTSLSKPVDTSVLYDYEVIQKISIKDKDQPNENWNFEAYAPRIFSRLRLAFGVNESAYVESLSQESLIKGLISGNWKSLQTLHNSGRSGSFIFKTHDDFLYVKSLPLSEWTHFRNILQDYYNYMVKNTDTLLTRFYGLYSITPPPYTDIPMITFIVMENCLSSTLEIDELYDLKGSTVNRSTPMDKRGSGVALKDLDYDLNKRKILIPEQLKRQLYNQIESDTKFLLIRNILDYSLLLGISYGDNLTDQSVINNEKKKSYQSIFQRDNGGTRGTMTRQIHYFFGIIDILTQWDINKMSEYGMKTFLLLQDSTQISAVKPPLYHKRFMDYMDKILKS